MLKKERNRYILLIILLFGVCIVLSLFLKPNRIKEYQDNIDAITDSLVVIRNLNGEQEAKIKAFKFNKLKDINKIKSQDKEIIRLQILTKKHKNSKVIVTVKGETKIDTIFNTVVDSSGNHPIYTSKINLNNWVTGESVATWEHTTLNLKIKNSYDVIITDKNEALVINHNPYSGVEKLRAAIISRPKAKKFGIGIQAGVTYNISNHLQPYLGLGISYNLIRF